MSGRWIAVGLAALGLVWAQQMPLEPPHDSGQSITGAFEGWFPNPDGSLNILVGYYNRNTKQEIDIPPGPNNRIEPGGPDQGQPTHFLPGRQWGMFTIRVCDNATLLADPDLQAADPALRSFENINPCS